MTLELAWLRMARRSMRGGAAGLVLTVLAVAWGVALVGAIRLANAAVLRAFVQVVETMAGHAALQVVAGEGGLFSDDVAATVAGVPGVETAVASVRGTAFTDRDAALVTVYGIDLTGAAAERVYGARVAVDDPLVFHSRPDSVALARSFAAARSLAPGSRLELVTPLGRRRFTVRGLLDDDGVARAYGGAVAVMDLNVAENVFTQPGMVNTVDVVLDASADPDRVADAIARRLPDGLHVEAPAQRRSDLRRVTRSLHVSFQALGLFGLVAAFLIAFNRLSTVFEERAWQLGVLRATGLSTGAIWRALVGESLLVGGAGVALGIPLAFVLGRLLVPVIAAATAVADKLVAPPTAVALEPAPLLLAGGLGLATAVLAATLPAWRAARVAVADTVRSRGREAPAAGVRRAWVMHAIAFAVVAVAVGVVARRPSAASGLAATGLLALGTALAARPAVGVSGYLLGVVSRRLAGAVGRFGAGSFLHSPRRTALTVATLGVGLGCVVWFWTVAESFRASLVATLTAALRADLVVTSVHVTSGYVEAPVSEELAGRLAAVPGVADVVASRVVDWPHAGRRVAIEALDAIYFRDPGLGRWPLGAERIPDVWERVARGEAAIVSDNFLANVGGSVGDFVVLSTPSGPLPLVIGGATPTYESPDGTIEMSRELFAHWWNDRQVNRVGLRLSPGADPGAVRATIARDLAPVYDLRVLGVGELIRYYAAQVGRAFAPFRVLAVTVLFVALLGVADTLLATVVARRRELAVARAIGVRRASLVCMVFVEAVLLGTLGLALALVSGLALAALWVRTTFPCLLGWMLDLYVPYREIPLLAALTVAVAGAAAMLPARRTARLDPGLALRQE